jgi:hypothetical protein
MVKRKVREYFGDVEIKNILTTTENNTKVDAENIRNEETKVKNEMQSVTSTPPTVITSSNNVIQQTEQPNGISIFKNREYQIIFIVSIIIILTAVYLYYRYRKASIKK